MRILLVHKHDQIFGGADTYVLGLGPALEAAGHEVRYLTTTLGEPHLKGETLDASTSHSTRDGATGGAALRIAAKAIWNPEAAAAARRLVEDFEPDVAHLHKIYPQISVSAIVALARLDIPLVQTTYDYEFISANPHDAGGSRRDTIETRGRYRALNTILGSVRRRVHLPRVQEWLTVSDFVTGRLGAHGIEGRTSPLTMVADRHPSADQSEHRSGAVFVGRMVEEKGVLDLLEAARRRPDLELTMVGGGPLEDQVGEAASQLPNLRWIPHAPHPEIAELLWSSALCVVPSKWEEPSGLIISEAMAAGTPMIVYDVGGVGPEAARAGSADVIEPSVDGLIEAWTDLLEDPQRQEQYRRSGLDYMDAEGSTESHVDLLEQTYQRAIEAA